MSGLPFALPPLAAVMTQPRAAALAALQSAGWRPWVTPFDLDAERRRLLNVDLTEPDVAWSAGGAVSAVAHVEADRAGRVTHLEITAAEPVDAQRVADALVPGAGAPRVGGGADAREWVWSAADAGGIPVRLWVCAERAYGDRLWAVVTLARTG